MSCDQLIKTHINLCILSTCNVSVVKRSINNQDNSFILNSSWKHIVGILEKYLIEALLLNIFSRKIWKTINTFGLEKRRTLRRAVYLISYKYGVS